MKNHIIFRHLLFLLVLLDGAGENLRGQTLPLRIRFPEKSQAVVSERIMRHGQEFRLIYDFDVRVAPTGKIQVKHSNARFLEDHGNKLGGTERRYPLLSTMFGKSAILEFDSEGELEAVVNMQEIVAALNEAFKSEAASDAQSKATVSKILDAINAEDGSRKVAELAASSWGRCVGTWIDWDVEPGEQERAVGEMEQMPGVTVRCEQVRTNHGKVSTKPLLWHLSVETKVVDPAYGKKNCRSDEDLKPRGGFKTQSG